MLRIAASGIGLPFAMSANCKRPPRPQDAQNFGEHAALVDSNGAIFGFDLLAQGAGVNR